MNILVALSGGVDSSVAAALLLEQGHKLVGATLKTFCYGEIDGGPKSCCGLEGVESAKAVANKLGIPHFVFDVSKRFKTEVIDDFVSEYANGRTPNPCVRCNATVKIPDLLQRAKSLGCDYIATGHYSRKVNTPEGPALFRGADRGKDQAYFLWAVPADVLPFLLLPLGDFTKPQVREKARQFSLSSAEKPESQEICFVPQGDYVDFLKDLLPPSHPGFQPGKIVDAHGTLIGRHEGYLGYTIGQRKGLGGGHGRRLFVTNLRPAQKEVIVGEDHDLHSTHLVVDSMNLLAPESFFSETVEIQIRHRSKPILGRRIEKKEGVWTFTLESEARAITPGQSAVFFSGDRLLGGGRIIT